MRRCKGEKRESEFPFMAKQMPGAVPHQRILLAKLFICKASCVAESGEISQSKGNTKNRAQ